MPLASANVIATVYDVTEPEVREHRERDAQLHGADRVGRGAGHRGAHRGACVARRRPSSASARPRGPSASSSWRSPRSSSPGTSRAARKTRRTRAVGGGVHDRLRRGPGPGHAPGGRTGAGSLVLPVRRRLRAPPSRPPSSRRERRDGWDRRPSPCTESTSARGSWRSARAMARSTRRGSGRREPDHRAPAPPPVRPRAARIEVRRAARGGRLPTQGRRDGCHVPGNIRAARAAPRHHDRRRFPRAAPADGAGGTPRAWPGPARERQCRFRSRRKPARSSRPQVLPRRRGALVAGRREHRGPANVRDARQARRAGVRGLLVPRVLDAPRRSGRPRSSRFRRTCSRTRCGAARGAGTRAPPRLPTLKAPTSARSPRPMHG